MTDETRQRLLDVLLSCEITGRYTVDRDFASYERDSMVRDAVERRLGIIGEALQRAAATEPNVMDQVPEFRHIVGLRNRVIHGYHANDNQIVWDVEQNHLPRLWTQIAVLITDEA